MSPLQSNRCARVLLLSACLLALPWSRSLAADLPVNSAAPSGTVTYTVQQGDTAFALAHRWGLDVGALLTLNHLSGPKLSVGQALIYPAPAAPLSRPVVSHTVQAGQTLYSIARQYGYSPDELQAFNRLTTPALKPGQVLLLPGSAPAAEQPALAAPARLSALPTPITPIASVAAPRTLPALPALQPAVSTTIQTVSAPAKTGVHTVQPGQTLYGIARQYGVRPEELLALNHLSSPALMPGQTIQVPASAVVQVVQTPVPAVAAFAPAAPLTVPAPLTVSALSVGTPLPLMSDESGPVSQPPLGPPPPQPQPAPDSNWRGADWHTSDWRSFAMSFMGVPYQFGGSSRSGTDCSGLVLQVFSSLGMKLPRQSAMQAQIGVPVDEQDLQAGDLVFFDTEGRGSVTHVGIYLGNGDFINANSFDGRVSVNQMTQKYFSQRYLGARRVIGVLAQGN
ncbi:LysM peptidoglycan-binding domain-containing protein [Deinococcus ruber]|uniref:Peptidoglycan endopeptidase n=1 Tax=Deinococcus ruber TaxID=1848197 RepID=A0A918BW65_9DEIO|nr:LysM peptidoglycan-binding domain-containing protein [Deinococcus ruber]GGQ93911.1 hypothetical protein GCM10008957_02520 [Deinococcus ruber]